MSEALEQALDVIEFELRPKTFAEPAPQLFQNTPRALRIDLSWDAHRRIVAILATP